MEFGAGSRQKFLAPDSRLQAPDFLSSCLHSRQASAYCYRNNMILFLRIALILPIKKNREICAICGN